MDVARWPRPVSNLRSVRSERVSSFALKSGTVGRIQLRPARSTATVPRHKRMCVCVSATEATVRRRRQASPSLPRPSYLYGCHAPRRPPLAGPLACFCRRRRRRARENTEATEDSGERLCHRPPALLFTIFFPLYYVIVIWDANLFVE